MHIRLLAGEPSGDLLGASLMSALKQRYPQLRFSGIGGPHMQAQGLNTEADMERLSVMGFFEPLKRLPELLRIRKHFVAQSLQDRPDLFIGIDSPDFNLPIAKKLKVQGVKTAHYVSPSVWAWRQKRVVKIRQSVDLMLTLFPFETEFYKTHAVPATFVGHPMADEIAIDTDQQEYRQQLQLDADAKILAVLPGSRMGEVRTLIPVFSACMRDLVAKHPDLQFVIPAANATLLAFLEQSMSEELLGAAYGKVTLRLGESRATMGAADAVLLASGTSTLEAMLLKKPMVMAYKLSAITYNIVKRMINVGHFALPNLLSDHVLVPEFIQDEATLDNLLPALESALYDNSQRALLLERYTDVHQQLRGGASAKACNAISELL